MKAAILFAILAGVWVLVMANRSLKRSIAKTSREFDTRGSKPGWGTAGCGCGTSRKDWKPLAMNRPDHTVLLKCPGCAGLWEEQMSLYGNKWRQVDETWARENYNFLEETGK